MKKILIASIITLAATAVSALDLGVTAGRDYAGTNHNTFGVSVGRQSGKFGVALGLDRQYVGRTDQNKYTLSGSYDAASVGSVTFAANAGVAYLDNQRGSDGSAVIVGVGATMPITKKVAATVDFSRQYGQTRVQASNGNTAAAGIKYSF